MLETLGKLLPSVYITSANSDFICCSFSYKSPCFFSKSIFKAPTDVIVVICKKKTTKKYMNQSTSQSVNQPISQSDNRRTSQSGNQLVIQPVNQLLTIKQVIINSNNLSIQIKKRVHSPSSHHNRKNFFFWRILGFVAEYPGVNIFC